MANLFKRGNRWLTANQLRELNNPKVDEVIEESVEETEEVVEDIVEEVKEVVEIDEDDIELLRTRYKEKTGSDVPVNMKNNVEWIKSKLI